MFFTLFLNIKPFCRALSVLFFVFAPFGFAPFLDKIDQNSTGLIGQSSNFILSWHLNGSGGGTLGPLTDLNDDTNYYKRIYINSA
jgi:hypothetical protein